MFVECSLFDYEFVVFFFLVIWVFEVFVGRIVGCYVFYIF